MTDISNVVESKTEDHQLEPKKADLGMRIGAFIIDHIIIVVVLLAPFLIFIFRNTQDDPAKIFRMFPILMVVAFFVYCLKDCVNGASIGKRVMGLAVRNSLDISVTPPISKLFVRNILTFIWPIEFLVIICSANKTKIGDKIAHTDVFRSERKVKISIIIITVVLAISIFVISLFMGISSIFKNDDSYKMAVSYIENNTEIITLIGEVQNYGFIPSGSLNYSGGYGQAVYSIKVIGSKNTIYVHVQMEKKPNKDWEITYFDYEN